MTPIYLPLARIILRYATALAFSIGWLSPDMAAQVGADPDLVMVVSAGLAALVEIGYVIARKRGGAT